MRASHVNARLQHALAVDDLDAGGAALADLRALESGTGDYHRAVLEGARMAAWRRRPEEAGGLLADEVTGSVLMVQAVNAARLTHLRALLDLVAGADPAASVERMDTATGPLRSRGVRFQLAVARLERAVFAPREPGAAEAAAEARPILEALGAVTLLRRLDAVFPAPSAERATPAPVTDPA